MGAVIVIFAWTTQLTERQCLIGLPHLYSESHCSSFTITDLGQSPTEKNDALFFF